MIKDLIKMANHFDKIGLSKQADIIDILIKKIASKDNEEEIVKRLCQNYLNDTEDEYSNESLFGGEEWDQSGGVWEIEPTVASAWIRYSYLPEMQDAVRKLCQEQPNKCLELKLNEIGEYNNLSTKAVALDEVKRDILSLEKYRSSPFFDELVSSVNRYKFLDFLKAFCNKDWAQEYIITELRTINNKIYLLLNLSDLGCTNIRESLIDVIKNQRFVLREDYWLFVEHSDDSLLSDVRESLLNKAINQVQRGTFRFSSIKPFCYKDWSAPIIIDALKSSRLDIPSIETFEDDFVNKDIDMALIYIKLIFEAGDDLDKNLSFEIYEGKSKSPDLSGQERSRYKAICNAIGEYYTSGNSIPEVKEAALKRLKNLKKYV
jgi:hypothetical protein